MFRAFLIVAVTVATMLTGNSAQADENPPCWTSFNDPFPGASLFQYYRNCNPDPVSVTAGTTNGSGQIYAIPECRYVLPGNWIMWDLMNGQRGRTYHTVLCGGGRWMIDEPGALNAPCWTSFASGAPNGGPMTQTYRNCNGSEISVAPAYRDSTGQITVLQEKCTRVPNGGVWQWNFTRTVQGVNYSTAICGVN